MYEVIFDPEAIDFLDKTEKQLAKRIWDKIISTKENPHHFFETTVFHQSIDWWSSGICCAQEPPKKIGGVLSVKNHSILTRLKHATSQ